MFKSYIGLGYNQTIILQLSKMFLKIRLVHLHYTLIKQEIAQGRLEAILNFQTMVIELSGMQIANLPYLMKNCLLKQWRYLFDVRSRSKEK
jgi:glycine dehydrogenase